MYSSIEFDCPGDGLCSNQGTCDDTTGSCICSEGFQGSVCKGNKGFLVILDPHDTWPLVRPDPKTSGEVFYYFHINLFQKWAVQKTAPMPGFVILQMDNACATLVNMDLIVPVRLKLFL